MKISNSRPLISAANLQFSFCNCQFAISCLAGVILALVTPRVLPAATPLPDGTLDSLAASLRSCLATDLPSPLYTTSNNWGHTKNVANGVTWRGKGLNVHPEIQKAAKADGIWTRLTLTAPNLRNSLALDLRNVEHTAAGATTFDANLSFDAHAEYERQNWKAGARLYSGSTRIRFRVKLALKCEVTARVERGSSLVPNLVVRMRVVKADASYDNLVFEHVVGLGGDAAKLIGEAVKGGLHRFQPNLERDLLAKANAAIVKAADTREVSLSLSLLAGR
jgi:hypothetical protein